MDARDLSWSPDGRWLLFRRLWLTGAFNSIGALPISPIYAVRTDGGRYELPPGAVGFDGKDPHAGNATDGQQ